MARVFWGLSVVLRARGARRATALARASALGQATGLARARALGLAALTLTLMALLVAASLVACAKAEVNDPSAGLDGGQEPSVAVTESGEGERFWDSPLVLGVPDATTSEVWLTNETGTDIVGIQFGETTGMGAGAASTVFGAQLIGSGERWYAEQPACIHIALALEAAATGAGTDASVGADSGGRAGVDIIFNALHDIRLTAADGSIWELHAVNLATLVDARVRLDGLDGSVAYLVYREDGAEASTLEAERIFAATS